MRKKLAGEAVEEVRFIQPDGLCEEAAEFWKWAAGVLQRSGRAHEGDNLLLDIAAQAFHDRQQAIDALKEHGGIMLTTETGITKLHPAVAAKSDASKRLKDMTTSLGLTPQSRADIGGRAAISQRELKDNPFNSLVKEAEEQNGTHERFENRR